MSSWTRKSRRICEGKDPRDHRRVQDLRKQAGYNVEDRIVLYDDSAGPARGQTSAFTGPTSRKRHFLVPLKESALRWTSPTIWDWTWTALFGWASNDSPDHGPGAWPSVGRWLASEAPRGNAVVR